jgi:hypothetical protein
MTKIEYDFERGLEKHTGEERLFQIAGLEFTLLATEKTRPIEAPGYPPSAAVLRPTFAR